MNKKRSKTIFSGKSVLITGGTGSFGKQFVSTLIKDYPEIERIIIYSRDEFKQFEMAAQPEFRNCSKLRFFVGDVRDKDRLYRAFDGVDIVIHAAALKQIPSCEYNPFEAVKTNIYGAQNVIDAAIDRNVEKVVALSTDKACSPINLYGATKLCSDKLFVAGNAYVGLKKTRFSVVRYGNVAGSRGSVVPFFKKLVLDGANFLPITDKKMTRFWLKLEEAVDLVLEALSSMQGGELYVKKIPSIKITDLAKAIAPEIPIKIVGVRPGEKVHELMISKDDARSTYEFDSHYIIYSTLDGINSDYGVKLGKKVKENFEYHSGNNSKWLNVAQIKQLTQSL